MLQDVPVLHGRPLLSAHHCNLVLYAAKQVANVLPTLQNMCMCCKVGASVPSLLQDETLVLQVCGAGVLFTGLPWLPWWYPN